MMIEKDSCILFLDIDDTLSNQKTIHEELKIMEDIGIDPSKYRKGEKDIQHLLSVSKYGLDMLDNIVSEFNITEIVISSTWRLGHSLNYIKLMFYYRGYPHLAKMIKDITPVIPIYPSELARKLEIKEYVEKNSIDKYYILDDMFIDIPGHYLVNTRGWGSKTDLSSLPEFKILN